MKNFKLIRAHDQLKILENGVLATSYFTRLKGLIGKQNLNTGEGMLFPDCNNIHMWMMSIPIDVVFLKTNAPLKEWSIVEVRTGIKPWKLFPLYCSKASDVLELPSGSVQKMNLKVGEVLCTVS